ncbi:Tyrosine-protein kinase Tec [Liparis tanakae]|uniref:Tyrosine-protein kinase Tec n=1 Tax=Liparis tanakae TaxID=230148 RepID=A0A4Z2FEQ6_9TELE|nr:Tyrosine-protein kinase Tec [Liparis tanakae]
MSAELLLEELLVKRSQQKKRTSPLNYKERLFVVHGAVTLYVFAPSNESRSLWVQSLKGEIKDNPDVCSKFHPHFWQEGAWLCCRQADKMAVGCEEYHLLGDSKTQRHTHVPPAGGQ